MANLTNKQIVIQSLKALHKQRTKILFKLKAIQGQKRSLNIDEKETRKLLKQVQDKMVWEVNTNGKTLEDKN